MPMFFLYPEHSAKGAVDVDDEDSLFKHFNTPANVFYVKHQVCIGLF